MHWGSAVLTICHYKSNCPIRQEGENLESSIYRPPASAVAPNGQVHDSHSAPSPSRRWASWYRTKPGYQRSERTLPDLAELGVGGGPELMGCSLDRPD